jgi:hypothetical protein
MKKMVKLMAVIVAVAMVCAMTVSTSAADRINTPTAGGVTGGITWQIKESAPGVLELVAPAAGLGGAGVAGWAFEQLKTEVVSGNITAVSHIRDAEDNDVEWTRAPQTNPFTANATGSFYVGAAPFPTPVAGGALAGTMNITGTGVLRITGEFTATGSAPVNLDFTISNVFETVVVTTAPEVTGGPTPTDAPATTADDEGAPKGGVVFAAILPAIVAAGVAVVASRKRK